MRYLIFVDVEATEGISPFTGRMTEFGAVDFNTKRTFHGVLWESQPDPANPAIPIITGKGFDEKKVMSDFADWLVEICGKNKPTFVSDNLAYDWQWINYYFDKTLGHNPFGHSGRRISDFYAGLTRDFGNTQQWKRWRRTRHDHNPVNDALGNVEAFEQIMELTK